MSSKDNYTISQKKALDIERNIFLSANAGAGKTKVLSGRFIEILKKKEVQIDNILALTFTDKAAGELLQKITKELDDAIIEEKKIPLKQKLIFNRELILSSKISTIHSFCSELLRQYPVEALVEFNFGTGEKNETDDLLKKIFYDTIIQETENKPDDDILKKIIYSVGYDKLNEMIGEMIDKEKLTEQIIKEFYSDGFEKYFGKILDIWDYCIKNNGSEMSFYPKPKSKKKKGEIIAETQIDKKRKLNKTEEAVQSILSKLKDEDVNPGVIIKDESDKYNKVLIIIDIYKKILKIFDREKMEKGEVSFNDMLIKADRLLDDPEVQNIVSKKYTHILVDEFQDTDEVQYSILKKISNNFDKNHYLFFIGDDKQSIYGFRNANLELFQNAKNEILSNQKGKDNFHFENEKFLLEEEEKQGAVILPENFRLAKSLITFNNRLFKKLLINDSVTKNVFRQVEYKELIYGRSDNHSGDIEIILPIHATDIQNDEEEVTLESKDTLESIEAERISNRILEMVTGHYQIYDGENKRNVEFKDFLILFRVKAGMKAFTSKFLEKGIPFEISGGRGFYQTDEIKDWVAFFKFLANPDDDISLVGLLRSPFFEVSDETFFEISRIDENISFYKKFIKFVSTKGHTELSQILTELNEYLYLASRLPLVRLIYKVLKSTHYLAIFNEDNRKTQIRANINKLISIAHNYQKTNFSNLSEFAKYLSINWQVVEDEGEALISEHAKAVRLMTVHASKGLESPVVVLPCIDKGMEPANHKGGSILEEYTGIRLKEKKNDMEPLSNVLNVIINNRRAEYEELRLMYVAFTRAKDCLIISATGKNWKYKNPSYELLKEEFLMNYEKGSGKVDIESVLTRLDPATKKQCQEDLKYSIQINDIITESRFNKDEIKKIDIKPVLFLDKLYSKKSEEVFTATNFICYLECGIKYLLRYILNYRRDSYERKHTEESHFEEKYSASEYGTIFHSVISSVSSSDINAEKVRMLISENSTIETMLNEKITERLVSDIMNLLKSKSGKYFNEKHENKIEMKLFSYFNGNYLNGTIDKLIIEKDRAIVIDYKTNNFNIKDYNSIVSKYSIQMDMYAFLANKYFGGKKKISSSLVFVNYPDSIYEKDYSNKDFVEIENKLTEIIVKILGNNEKLTNQERFPKNLSHCKFCEYFVKDKCALG